MNVHGNFFLCHMCLCWGNLQCCVLSMFFYVIYVVLSLVNVLKLNVFIFLFYLLSFLSVWCITNRLLLTLECIFGLFRAEHVIGVITYPGTHFVSMHTFKLSKPFINSNSVSMSFGYKCSMTLCSSLLNISFQHCHVRKVDVHQEHISLSLDFFVNKRTNDFLQFKFVKQANIKQRFTAVERWWPVK